MENKKKNTFVLVIQYFLVVCCFLYTILFMPSIASLVFAILGIILIPPIWNKLKLYVNKVLLIIISIVIFLIACMLSPTESNENALLPTSSNLLENNINNSLTTNIVTNSNTNSSTVNETTNETSNETSNNSIENNTINNATSKPKTTTSNTNTTTTNKNTETSNVGSSYNNTTTKSSSSERNSASTPANTDSTSSGEITNNNSNSEMVWVGNTGTKYHYQDCRTLKGKGHQITLKQALSEGREACKVCH